jgi:hypothetical protein
MKDLMGGTFGDSSWRRLWLQIRIADSTRAPYSFEKKDLQGSI